MRREPHRQPCYSSRLFLSAPAMSEPRFFATAARHLETLLAEELSGLGVAPVAETRAGVRFGTTLADAYRVCLWSRVANRVLMPLAQFPADSPEALLRRGPRPALGATPDTGSGLRGAPGHRPLGHHPQPLRGPDGQGRHRRPLPRRLRDPPGRAHPAPGPADPGLPVSRRGHGEPRTCPGSRCTGAATARRAPPRPSRRTWPRPS